MTIKDVTSKIGSGATPTGGDKAYKTSGISLIRSQNVLDMSFSREGLAHIDEEQAHKLDGVTVCEEDVLLNITGDSIARCCMVPVDILPARVNQHVSIVRANKTSPKYLLYFLQYLKPHLMQICKVGGTRNALTKEAIEELPFWEVENADKAVQILSNIDEAIQNNIAICSSLEAMAKLLYDYWFVQFDFPDADGKPYKSSGGKMVWNEELKREIPEGWEVISIGEITECHDSERIPVSNSEREAMKGDIPYYGATGIMGYVNRAIFSGDYVLMAEDGSVMDDKGHPIIQRVSGDVWINNHAHVLKPIKGYSCRLLMMVLKDIPVVQIKTGSIQMKINQENMNKHKVVKIPNHLIQAINKPLNIIDEQMLLLQNENRQLASLRDFLLPMLMNGQVKVGKAHAPITYNFEPEDVLMAAEETRYGGNNE